MLTTEQMIGQILLILQAVDRRLKELRRERASHLTIRTNDRRSPGPIRRSCGSAGECVHAP
jgi:hypothetical protein